MQTTRLCIRGVFSTTTTCSPWRPVYPMDEMASSGVDKSLALVPLHVLNVAFFKVITVYQWVDASASMIPLAMLISAPFYITTILMDCILGIVNKTAQQIPVFQLSASIKPVLGLIIFFVTVPTLFPLIRHLMLSLLLRI